MASGPIVTAAAPGIYTLTTTDAASHSSSCQAQLLIDPTLACSVSGPLQAVCSGSSTTLTTIISGGTAPFTDDPGTAGDPAPSGSPALDSPALDGAALPDDAARPDGTASADLTASPDVAGSPDAAAFPDVADTPHVTGRLYVSAARAGGYRKPSCACGA